MESVSSNLEMLLRASAGPTIDHAARGHTSGEHAESLWVASTGQEVDDLACLNADSTGVDRERAVRYLAGRRPSWPMGRGCSYQMSGLEPHWGSAAGGRNVPAKGVYGAGAERTRVK